MLKLTRKVKIKNSLGLHARPATFIAKLLHRSRSSVTFTHRKETIDARSIMSILMLGVGRHGQVTITVEGDDAKEIMDQLVVAFETKFGEENL